MSEIVKAMRKLDGDHLRELRIDVAHTMMPNEHAPVHNFIEGSYWTCESWFRMFRHFASFPNLATLQLLGGLAVCPEFFRCVIDHPGTPFPALIEFVMQFTPETADGTWFYKRDDGLPEPGYDISCHETSQQDMDEHACHERGYDRTDGDCSDDIASHEGHERPGDDGESDDEDGGESDSWYDSDDYCQIFGDGPLRTRLMRHDRFRSLPSRNTFLPFLLDASRASMRLSKIRKLILQLGHDQSSHLLKAYPDPYINRVFELWYLKAGTARSPSIARYWFDTFPKVAKEGPYLNQNRLYWRVDDWKPWEEVQAAWNRLAGPDAKIVFFEEDKWTRYQDSLTYQGEL